MKGFFYLAWFVLLLSCQKPQTVIIESESKPKYASKYLFTENGVSVLEPWPGATQSKHYVIDSAMKRIVVTSTTHLPYLEMLGIGDRLVGFPGTKYISSEYFINRVTNGHIIDLGPDGNMNLELLYNLEPNVVIAFDMGGESAVLNKLEQSGIQVIYNSDFLENTALGRAEWIRFFGALFQRQEQADSIFNVIDENYTSLKSLTTHVAFRPAILTGVMYGDAWFLPGGKNFSSTFYQDAGGKYLWEENPSNGWLELSFESVFDQANEADFWIGIATTNTLNELLEQDTRYGAFNAFKNGQIYNYHKRISPSGGYDYFESGYARPDLILADLISILHPELLPDYETYYFQRVE